MSASKARGGASRGRSWERSVRTPRQERRAWQRAALRAGARTGTLGMLRLARQPGLGFRARSLAQQVRCPVCGEQPA